MRVRVSNREARRYVQQCLPFTGSHTFGEWNERSGYTGGRCNRYVAYSYGTHWPLFIYDSVAMLWFENSSKYGVTTSRHHSQLHPLTETISCPVEIMKRIAAGESLTADEIKAYIETERAIRNVKAAAR